MMFWLDVDIGSFRNTLHRDDCIDCILEETDLKGVNELKEGGGWLRFDSPGEAARYLKTNRISGSLVHCKLCSPIDDVETMPYARLEYSACGADGKPVKGEIKVLDTKGLFKELTRKFLGKR